MVIFHSYVKLPEGRLFGDILMNHESKYYLPSIIYNEHEDSLFNIILVLYLYII